MRDPSPILVTGATGYVGSQLVSELRRRGHTTRTLSRRGSNRGDDRRGDVLSGDGLREALDGVKTAYYLVHSMGDGDDFAAKDRQAAINFAEAAAGVERVIYLGGLGSTDSEHLRSRHEVARELAARVPLVYMRAAMIIGPGSASYDILRYLVRRLPVMIVPRWLDTKTQPVALSDVLNALADVAGRDDAPAEVQLGGADVLTYREMMRRAAPLMGRRPPLVIRVPVLTPRLSSYWIALVTPVNHGIVEPLVDGLKAEMIVDTPPPAGLNDNPLGFEDAVRAALP
ncbi:MAG TPA: NAD-dependent epimerase/dehydratase family protein [Solirubrobacter sp.]|jgi:uncharacterized protein YbjT (DUF2867 family)|nr:NAD-dependent epimerase/dehydratase family protein [Solirubrobacter sp.]